MVGGTALTQPLADATRAWAQIGSGQTVGADMLTDGDKSTVLRLRLTGGRTRTVIAKRAAASSVSLERTVYSQVLSEINVDAARYLGCAPDEDQRLAWLFLEDVPGHAPDRVDDAAVAGRWLARMHVSSLALHGSPDLPDRGADHYLARLRTARHQLISRLEVELGQHGNEARALEIALRACDEIEASWAQVAAFTDSLPRVLVHGDFSPENLMLSVKAGRRTLVALDWEKAGWGPAAADLGWVDIGTYLRAVRPTAPSLSLVSPELLLASGALFRVLSHDWARKTARKVGQYVQRLRTASLSFQRAASSLR